MYWKSKFDVEFYINTRLRIYFTRSLALFVQSMYIYLLLQSNVSLNLTSTRELFMQM